MDSDQVKTISSINNCVHSFSENKTKDNWVGPIKTLISIPGFSWLYILNTCTMYKCGLVTFRYMYNVYKNCTDDQKTCVYRDGGMILINSCWIT